MVSCISYIFRYVLVLPSSGIGVANANFCRSGWTRINNVCYAYVQATVTFPEAEQACQNSGGAHLASVVSLYQQAGLLWLVRNGVSDSHVWIGLNDRQTEGLYEWTDSTSVRYMYISFWFREHRFYLPYL